MRSPKLIVASILAPTPLAAFMLATADGIVSHRAAYLIAAVVLAHVLFWVAFFLAKFVLARLKVHAPRALMVLTYGFVFLVLSCSASIIAQQWQGDFRWLLLVRDSISISLAGVASYILYLAIARGSHEKSAVSGA
jgi:cell division protein FtsW (lipid II flippase)